MIEQNVRPDVSSRYTEGDHKGIRWIVEEGAVQLEQMQRVLVRLSPNPEKLASPEMLSMQHTRKKKDNLQEGHSPSSCIPPLHKTHEYTVH